MLPFEIATRSGQWAVVVVGSWPTKTLSLADPMTAKPLTVTLLQAFTSTPSRSFALVIFVAVMFWQGTPCAVYSESNHEVSKHASWLFWQARPSRRRSWLLIMNVPLAWKFEVFKL